MTSTTRLLSFMLCGAIACAVSACVAKSEVTTCGVTGVLCAKGFHCAAAQGICIEDANTICGDLKKDDGEACDDGNNIDGDGCSANCHSTEECGNGTLDKPFPNDPKNERNEDCDTPLKIDPRTNLFCSAKCKFEQCGNGVTDTNIGEICDDGNTTGGDGCAADCKSTELCGNHKLDQPFKDGNGVPDLNDPRNEVCDDGNNVDGDGCAADCRSTEACGNGKIDPGEECDDGLDENGESKNGDDKDCRADCIINRCGDGHPNLHGLLHREGCDDGQPSMDDLGHPIPAPVHSRDAVPRETGSCNIDCSVPACGDGKVNHSFQPSTAPAGRTEECDDGAGNNKDTRDCTAGCQVNVCGDGLQDTEGNRREGCDDGNRNDRDTCSNACVLATCGDGIVGPGEDCDLGSDSGNNLNTDGSACPGCVAARCGDHKIHIGFEECDGADVGTAHCSATCHLENCGNGIIDPGEECDKGAGNNNNGDCRTDCILNRCGDGYVNSTLDTDGHPIEDCEGLSTPAPPGSRNLLPTETSGCNLNCKSPRCGDGILNTHFTPMGAAGPEQCDDGGNAANDSCSPTCQFERCGNLTIDPPEECDGAPVDGFPCSASCRLQKCGNHIVDPGEECDNGNDNGDDKDCRPDCIVNRCGDGRVNEHGVHTEECDGGPTTGAAIPTNTASCNSTCKTAACGDGFLNPLFLVPPANLPEQCDDHNTTDGDGCEANCSLPRCGNGVKDAGEDCDDGNLSNDDDCLVTCKTPTCGDGFIRSHPHNDADLEECDDALGPFACVYNAVSQPCDVCASCVVTHPTAPFCGDGNTDVPNETCDSHNLTCGACASDCQSFTREHASGLIFAAAGKDLATTTPTDTFTLKDGFGHTATFEFTNGTPATGNIKIGFTAASLDNTVVAGGIVTAITGARATNGLQITATQLGSIVILTNDRFSSLGNGTALDPRLSEAVVTSNFAVVEMSGGQGGDCPLDDPCATNADCASNLCTAGKCVDPAPDPGMTR